MCNLRVTSRGGQRAKTGERAAISESDEAGQWDQRMGEKDSSPTCFKPIAVGQTELIRKEIRTQGTDSVKYWEGERRRDRQLLEWKLGCTWGQGARKRTLYP